MATVNDYTRTTWQTGDVIDATKMNNIETQLDAVTDNARENGIAPVFSTTKTYAVGEHVLYNGEVYRCKTAVTSAGAWVASNWTKASLSEDLEGEVSELKSALRLPKNLIDGVTLTSGRFIYYTDGIPRNSPICDVSDYIDITGITKIVYPRLSLISTSDNSGIAFYNEQKEYISGVRCIRGAETNGSVLDIASVPMGAKYVRLSLIKSDPKYLYNYRDYSDSLGVKLDNTCEVVDSIENGIAIVTGTQAVNFEDGYIDIPATGAIVSLSRIPFENRKSAYAEVSEGQAVTVNVVGVGTSVGGGRAWAFLDSDYTVLIRGEQNTHVKDVLYAPVNAKYVVLNTRTDTINDYYGFIGHIGLSDVLTKTKSDVEFIKEDVESIGLAVSDITGKNLYSLNELNVTQSWIDIPNGVIDDSISIPPRLVVVPVAPNAVISVNIPHVSTKRVAFCDSVADGSIAYNSSQFEGQLIRTFKNENHKYFVIQLFINSDVEQNYLTYYENSEIYTTTAVDSFARSEIEKLKESGGSDMFIVENLKGLPILDSFGDIDIVGTAYADCAAFHELVKTELCDTSDGYVVQTLLGNDGHGNNLYKYVTNPKTLKYGANRRFGTPDYPISGGSDAPVFTVILTTNIHGVEHGANWVVYNLLKKMQNADTDMIRFFRDCVKIIWIPYICASGEYENADGININRDFPTTVDGVCTSAEGNIVKAVIDEYAPNANLHIDIHTFTTSGQYGQYFSSWTFTDSEKLGKRSVRVAQSVVGRYSKKYPNIDILKREVVSAVNTPTTCTYYTQKVYGVPSGTIEGALAMPGSPEGAESHTSATAYLYDIITQVICAMAS